MTAIGARLPEAYVVKALALTQQGDTEQALTVIEMFDTTDRGSRPFAEATEALIRSCSGDHLRARELAGMIADSDVSTYLDDVFAGVACASSCHAAGLHDAAIAAAAALVVIGPGRHRGRDRQPRHAHGRDEESALPGDGRIGEGAALVRRTEEPRQVAEQRVPEEPEDRRQIEVRGRREDRAALSDATQVAHPDQ